MTEKPASTIHKFLTRLQDLVEHDDRGALADLRRGFSEANEHRAWPYIANWCRRMDIDRDRRIWLTVAAGFATHLRTSPKSGNMGDVVRKMAVGQDPGRPRDALKSFEGRFRRLLTCAEPEELCRHLTGIIRAAERKGIPIDFERLFWDLQKWDKPDRKTKIEWAAHYWAAEPEAEKGEAA